jgi:hypothetical protein
MLLELMWRNVGNSAGLVLWNDALAYLKVASGTPSGPYPRRDAARAPPGRALALVGGGRS